VPDDFADGSHRQVHLQAPPAKVPQYLRAALPRWGPRPDAVPEVVLRLPGLRPQPEAVARYAAVVGQPAGDRLPLLYPQLLGFGLQLKIMTDSSFPFPPLGLVHVANEVTVTRPMPLGARLDVAVHPGAVRAHPRGRLVDLVTVVHCDGEPTWTGTSSYLRRERSGGGSAREPESPSAATASPAAVCEAAVSEAAVGEAVVGEAAGGEAAVSEAVVGEAAGGEAAVSEAVVGEAAVGEAVIGEAVVGEAVVGEAAVGEAVVSEATASEATASVRQPGDAPALHLSARWRLPGDLGRRYARVSGDLNPIHLTSWTARPLGFPRAIAHGMWTAAAVLGALEGRLPEALTYTVQFRRPIPLPSTVRLFTGIQGGHIAAEVRGRDGDDRVHLVADLQGR
jgi:acyl dehydratase